MKRSTLTLILIGILAAAPAAAQKATSPAPRNAAPAASSPTSPATAAPAPSATVLTLTEARAIAAHQRPRLLAALATAAAYGEAPAQVRSAYFPQVLGEMTGVTAANGDRITAGALNNPVIYSRYADGLAVSQLLTDFGRTGNLVKSSVFAAKSAQENALTIHAQALLAVDQAYYDALQARAVLEVAQQAVRERALVARQVSLLAQNKLRSEVDVSFAKVNLAQAQLFLTQAQNGLESSFADLSLALGYGGPRSYRLAEEPMPVAPSSDLASLVAEAYQKRPELASSRFQMDSAQAYAQAEHDLWYPTLSAAGAAGVTPLGATQLSTHYAAAGFNLSIPVFNGHLFGAEHAQALFEAEAAQRDLQELRNQIAHDVRLAWLNANTADQRLSLTRQLLEQAALALRLAQARYNLGLSTIVELSQAQLNETQAQIDQAQAKYQFQMATDALNYQLGLLQ